MLKISPSTLPELELYRIQYFESLPRFQDLFLEFLIVDSVYYQLILKDVSIGYAIVAPEKYLVEFYIEPSFADQAVPYFKMLVKHLSIAFVYCKSFDPQLLNCCLSSGFPYALAGCFYRDYLDKGLQLSPNLTFRFAEEADLKFLSQQDDEVFEPYELLPRAIAKKEIILLHQGDAIIGCGFLTQVHPKYHYFDIGVWVDAKHRNMGFATQIILYLKNLCLHQNWIPICGCDIANIASQKTLEKVGFFSHYKLLEFKVIDK